MIVEQSTFIACGVPRVAFGRAEQGVNWIREIESVRVLGVTRE